MVEIRAVMIVEVLGKPAEHVKKMLEEHVGKIDDMKGVSTQSISVSEPKALENNKEIFTCFAEVEVVTDTFLDLVHLIFDYMPSSVEIIKPDVVDFHVSDATSFLNDLAGRLHSYDNVAKVAKIQMYKLNERIKELEGEQIVLDKKKDVKKKKGSGKKSKKKKG